MIIGMLLQCVPSGIFLLFFLHVKDFCCTDWAYQVVKIWSETSVLKAMITLKTYLT